MRRIMGKTDQERKEIYAIPAWVALRWFIVCLFRGPKRADKYIRPQDRA